MSQELQFADNISLDLIDWIQEFLPKLTPEFPIHDFEHLCTKVSVEDLAKCFDIIKTANLKLHDLWIEFHNLEVDFKSALDHVNWLKENELEFYAHKAEIESRKLESKVESSVEVTGQLETAPEQKAKDAIANMNSEDAAKLLELLKKRYE